MKIGTPRVIRAQFLVLLTTFLLLLPFITSSSEPAPANGTPVSLAAASDADATTLPAGYTQAATDQESVSCGSHGEADPHGLRRTRDRHRPATGPVPDDTRTRSAAVRAPTFDVPAAVLAAFDHSHCPLRAATAHSPAVLQVFRC